VQKVSTKKALTPTQKRRTNIAVIGIVVAGIVIYAVVGSHKPATDWNTLMFSACADVETIAQGSSNGTIAANSLPGYVQTFYNDSIIGDPALKAGALSMQQAMTSIKNGAYGASVIPKYQAGLRESLQACSAVGD
jgi:hypothetical protein